ncbi:hypothetical protein Hamer_G002527 [Homarus americanus]|uniref:Uncharacterized protein n=1 Tax=Homarus americanus TaxID=6706 RepID=A0A8J5K8G1_HOMAM|nr:hypothetical protein Hamer_G002527 [Homarus americanus]
MSHTGQFTRAAKMDIEGGKRRVTGGQKIAMQVVVAVMVSAVVASLLTPTDAQFRLYRLVHTFNGSVPTEFVLYQGLSRIM